MAFVTNCIVEIPKGSNVKYEITPEGKLFVDRILAGDFRYPANYGFIPHTIDWDGDPLDVLIVGDFEIVPTCQVEVRIVGAMKMVDDGETDTKLVGVVNDDFNNKHIQDIKDVPQEVLDSFMNFFKHYKDYKNKVVLVPGFEDAAYAEHELAETKELFAKYSTMDKDAFVEKMKSEHPEKYTF